MSFWTGIRDAITSPVRAIAGTVSDIASGENVVKSLEAGIYGTISAPQALVNAGTGGALGRAGIPLVSDTAQSATELTQNRYNRGAQGRYFQRSARNLAVAAGGYYAGPLIAGQTGLGAGASTAVAGKITYDLSQGNVSGALQTGLGTLGPLSTPFGDINPQDLVSQFTKSVGTLPRSPVETFNQPSQTVVYPKSNASMGGLLVFAGIAGLTFLFLKGRK